MKSPIFFVISLLVLMALACSFSTAKISDAKMAKDADGNQPTTTFAQDEPFYCVVTLSNAPDDTKIKAVWTAVEAEGVEPNLNLGEKELTSGDGELNFSYTNAENKLWPVGKYKVDLLLNDKPDRSLEFQVEPSAAAVEPTPTPEPTATSEPTPTLEPTEEAVATAEPTVEVAAATVEPTAEPTGESSAGDSLVIASGTTEPTEEASQYEPLPFQAEPYVHPSGAFTFALPESFKSISDDETSVAYGDDRSVVGVMFVNPGVVYTEKQMQTFIDKAVGIIMDNYADDHTILKQTPQPDDSIYVEVSYTSTNGDGYADFFFEQRDTVVFILYFVTVAYDEMLPTWNQIIDSYSVDPDAALVAAPADTPTAAPQPEPTKPPVPAGPQAPAGKGLFIFNNHTGVDFVIDVIGPTNDSKVIPPQQSQQFVLDPGHYTINGHSPGGDYYINAYSFDIAAGQVFPLDLN